MNGYSIGQFKFIVRPSGEEALTRVVSFSLSPNLKLYGLQKDEVIMTKTYDKMRW